MSVCYFLMPAPGAVLENINTPMNINYVFGFNDSVAQTQINPNLYFSILMIGLPMFVYYPTSKALSLVFEK